MGTPPAFVEFFKSLAFIHVGFFNLRVRPRFLTEQTVATATERLSSHACNLETRSLAKLPQLCRKHKWHADWQRPHLNLVGNRHL